MNKKTGEKVISKEMKEYLSFFLHTATNHLADKKVLMKICICLD
jgi:hypothetical protein